MLSGKYPVFKRFALPVFRYRKLQMSSAPKVLFLTFGVLLFAGREMPVIALYAGKYARKRTERYNCGISLHKRPEGKAEALRRRPASFARFTAE